MAQRRWRFDLITRRSRLATAVPFITISMCLPASAFAAQLWEIDTYGNGAMLEAVFKGLALFAGPGGGLPGALKLAGLIGLLALLVAMAGTALGGGQMAASFPYVAIVAGTVATLSTSHVPVAVVDKIAATSTVIDGIPLPIAIIGYFTSTLGSRITEQVEQAILPVDVERFMTHGLGWGPRVMQATVEAQIQDPALRQDLDMYIQICVSENFNSGHKTAKDLTQGTTVEQVLGDTNPAIPFVLPSQYLASPPNQTCLDAWTGVLSPALSAHATSPEVLGFLAMQLGLPSYSDVLPAITDISGDLLKVSESASELLKLRFGVNQLLPSLQAMSAVGNQSGMVTAWALAEAQAQQTSSWLTTGLLLQQVLPVFHAALEFLFYGFLLLGLPLLMVMPRMSLQILQTALFLQLWPVAYVFGNLFLYTQVSKVSFLTGDATQGLGLSLAATPAIQGSIQNAYAASGFPILIGVMMLAGMIFGGGFAMQKVISSGPFNLGGASGVGLGNIGMGNVSAEQRNVVPTTTEFGFGPGGEPAIVRSAGFRDHPLTQEFTLPGLGQLELQGPRGAPNSSVAFTTPGNTAQVTAGPAGGTVSDSQFSARGTRQATASREQAFAAAQANTERSEQRVGQALSDSTSRALNLTAGASLQQGNEEVTARRDELQHGVGQAAENALRESHTFDNALQQANQHGVTFDAGGSAGGGLLGVLSIKAGANGQISARDLRTNQEIFQISGNDAKKFTESFNRNMARSDTVQRSLTGLESAARQKGLGIDLSNVRREEQAFAKAQETSTRASDSLRDTQSAGQLVERNQLFAFDSFTFDRNDPQAFGRALLSDNPTERSAAMDHFTKQTKINREGGPEFREDFDAFQKANPSQETQETQKGIQVGKASIEGVSQASQGPRTLGQFQKDVFGQDPVGPSTQRTQFLKDRVILGTTDKEFKTIQGKTDEAQQQVGQAPSAETLHNRLEKGETRKPSALQERTMILQGGEVTREAANQVVTPIKQAADAIGKAIKGDQAPGPTPQAQ